MRSELSRIRLGKDAALLESGRCACGNFGKPSMTLEGSVGYLCLSCLLREAVDENAPRILGYSDRLHPPNS